MRLTHVINPFRAEAGSEHDRAQRITFASLRAAVDYAQVHGVEVQVLAAVYPEDAAAVEPPAQTLPALRRSVQDIQTIRPVRRFPLISDLLQAGAQQGTGQYMIYTNVDIAVQRHFYVTLAERIAGGQRDFVATITRRKISEKFVAVEQLEEMYAAPSTGHPGCDCFVFPRCYVGRFDLGHACIGNRHFDLLLVANLDAVSGHGFRWLRDEFLTFHIGDDREWASRVNYEQFNLRQALAAMRRLRKRMGAVPPGSYFEAAQQEFERHETPWQWTRRQLKRIKPLVSLHRRIKQERAQE